MAGGRKWVSEWRDGGGRRASNREGGVDGNVGGVRNKGQFRRRERGEDGDQEELGTEKTVEKDMHITNKEVGSKLANDKQEAEPEKERGNQCTNSNQRAGRNEEGCDTESTDSNEDGS